MPNAVNNTLLQSIFEPRWIYSSVGFFLADSSFFVFLVVNFLFLIGAPSMCLWGPPIQTFAVFLF